MKGGVLTDNLIGYNFSTVRSLGPVNGKGCLLLYMMQYLSLNSNSQARIQFSKGGGKNYISQHRANCGEFS